MSIYEGMNITVYDTTPEEFKSKCKRWATVKKTTTILTEGERHDGSYGPISFIVKEIDLTVTPIILQGICL